MRRSPEPPGQIDRHDTFPELVRAYQAKEGVPGDAVVVHRLPGKGECG